MDTCRSQIRQGTYVLSALNGEVASCHDSFGICWPHAKATPSLRCGRGHWENRISQTCPESQTSHASRRDALMIPPKSFPDTLNQENSTTWSIKHRSFNHHMCHAPFSLAWQYSLSPRQSLVSTLMHNPSAFYSATLSSQCHKHTVQKQKHMTYHGIFKQKNEQTDPLTVALIWSLKWWPWLWATVRPVAKTKHHCFL